MKLINQFLFTMFFISTGALANVSASIGVNSNYLFNGVSQTANNPALQIGINWEGNGAYFSLWGSNVDFGDDTNIEADLLAGYILKLNEDINFDFGIAQYSYHGHSQSKNFNYAEAWSKFNYKNTSIRFWFSWDYFGTEANHSIWMVNHDIPLTDNFMISLSIDRSNSHDKNKWVWQKNDASYVHGKIQASYQTPFAEFFMSIHHLDLVNDKSDRLVVGINKSFNF